MAITTLPPAPSRADPTNFATKADALLGALSTFVSEVNVDVLSVNTKNANVDTKNANVDIKALQVAQDAIQTALDRTSSTNSASGIVGILGQVTQLKNDAVDALNSAAITEDWGFITEAVTETRDYGVL
jgi:hypothetical protein